MENTSTPRFIYLIQGDGSQKPYDIPEGSDFLVLQWQSAFVPGPNNFHFPKSTWSGGRNELLRRAKECGLYDYFVFLDDDVAFGGASLSKVLHHVAGFTKRYLFNIARGKASIFRYEIFPLWHALTSARRMWSLRDFEKAVERTKPLVAYPNALMINKWYDEASLRETDGVRFGDQFFVCIHRSVVDRILPYDTKQDAQNWWYSGFEFCRTSSNVCKPGKIHRYNRLIAYNKASRPYPRKLIQNAPSNDIHAPDCM